MDQQRRIGRNEQGYRVGESHQHATLSDAQVRQIRDLHELGDDAGVRWSLGRIARELGLCKSTVQKICAYTRRNQTPREWSRA